MLRNWIGIDHGLIARNDRFDIDMLNRQWQLARAACFALVSVCSLFEIAGQTNDANAEAHELEEIIVTALRREEGVYDVPAALSALPGHTLDERGIVEVFDVGKFVPNLTVTKFSAGHTSAANPFIRGIGLQDHLITADPGVSVYVDGVYLGRQIGQNLNLANIERIEVLRGPQGTLYGRNSIGGAINIVTSEPGSDPRRTFSARLGSRDRLDTDVFVDHALSDELAVSFSGGFHSRAGVGSFVKLPNATAQVGETREVAARLALSWQLSPVVSLLLSLDGNDGKHGLNPYTTQIDEIPFGALYASGYRNTDVSPDPYDSFSGQLDLTSTTNDSHGIAVTGEWFPTDRVSAKFIASKRRSDYDAGLDDDSLFDDFLSFPETGDADQTSLEVQFSGDFDSYDYIAGVHRFNERGENLQNPTVFLGFPGRFRLGQEVDSRAVFGNIGFTGIDHWRFSAGIRFTEDYKLAWTDVGIGTTLSERRWTELTWDFTARYRLQNGMSTYATLQSGYQSGQFPARPYCLFVDPDCFVASDNITAQNLEAGLKGKIRTNVEMSVALFRTQYRDLPYQVSTTIDDGFNTVNLIVDQVTSGFELEARWLISPSFTMQFALGQLDVQVDEVAGVQPVAPLTPDTTLAVSPVFKHSLSRGGEISFRFDLSWRDEMWGEPSSDLGRLTRIEPRDLINVNLSYVAPQAAWKLSLYGQNVADSRYDNARLNTGDYLLRILSNDVREFGLQFERDF